jgi:hypothetical protein
LLQRVPGKRCKPIPQDESLAGYPAGSPLLLSHDPWLSGNEILALGSS